MRTLLLDSAIRKLDPALHKMAEIRIPTGWDPASNAMAQRNLTVEYGDKTVLNATITAVSNLADDSIHPLLGDENYAKYKFYQDTLIFRAALGRLTFALDSTQTDQLLTLLAASNPPYPEPTQPMVNADVLAKASDFLTPTQISSLKPVAEKQARDAALISEALSKLEN
jgi:hypothetical protein